MLLSTIVRFRIGRDLARLLARAGIGRERLEVALSREVLEAVARSRGSR
jgi:hypothetical protein